MMRAMLVAAGAVVLAVAPLRAQVGYEPRRSPYDDLGPTQEITFYTGWYHAKRDAAGIAPQSGAIGGALYQWRAGGPANLSFSVARVASERELLDPDANACPTGTPGNCKSIGTFRWPMYFFDGAFALGLTGARSFFRLVPEVRLGAGLVSDFHTQTDLGNFAFGTRFAFNWGGGIRLVPGGRFQFRADLINHLYSIKYPDQYYQPAPDGTFIFADKRSTSAWLNNPALTIGMSYLFSK